MDLRRRDYEKQFPILVKVVEIIRIELEECLRDEARIDKISTRPKDVDRFVEKANRIDEKNGKCKYENPLEDIQDQIGARVVVFYKSDVEPITEKILSQFREIENERKRPDEPEHFGYEARHLICIIPPDIRNKYKSPIDFFELQVATLFQHAWAEANHNLGYRSRKELSYEKRRKIAWAAAQAWGADLIFDDLWKNHKH